MIFFRIEKSTACVWSETGPRALGSPFRNPSAALSSPSAFSFQSAQKNPFLLQLSLAATAEITVSDPGKAVVEVRDPRPLRPPARKRRNKTQVPGAIEWITFKCYGEDVTVDEKEAVVCNGPP